LVKTLDQVCFASPQYYLLDAHISNVDKSHAKTRTTAIKNPHKGACCYGEVHVLVTALFSDSVQMATLSVQEAMGVKVDREAVATLVLPQLWTMSMGPCAYRPLFPGSLT
jgi:hypothetical protein